MTGRPVNIADFRCRAIKARAAQFSLRDASRPTGLRVVEPVSADEAVVFDIGMARDSQRFRHRTNTRPIAIQNGAKVIRFGEGRRLAAAALRAPQPLPAHSNGPFDLPPAA